MTATGKAAVRAQFEIAEEIEAILPENDSQDDSAADHGPDYDPEQDYDPEDRFAGDNGGPGFIEADNSIEAELASVPLNDLGNGRRLSAHYGSDLAFVARLGWFRWTGKVWQPDEDELRVRALAHNLPDHILAEIPFVQPSARDIDVLEQAELSRDQWVEIEALPAKDRDPSLYRTLRELMDHAKAIKAGLVGRRKSHREWSRQTGNTNKLTNALIEARVAQALQIGQFNADAAAINCQSGVIRFVPDELAASYGDSGRFEILHCPHAREDRITKICTASYNPDAPAVVWQAFLERIMPDPAMREFLQRWFGYSLTGFTTEHKLCFFYGHGRNGKSTLVDTIAEIFADYATTVPIETLTGSEQRKGSDATPDLVRIPGARMVRASEPEEGQQIKEALIKALTGGEPIMIRRMMQEFVEVTPEFKLTISGNHKPEIRGGDDGIWSRVLLIPFGERIPDHEIDQLLPQKLKAERDAIFAWIIEGARKWFTDGLKIPESVRAATDGYREESDQIGTFLRSGVTVTGDAGDDVTAKALIDAFSLWQIDNGGSPWTSRLIQKKMKASAASFVSTEGHRFTSYRSSIQRYGGLIIPETYTERAFDVGRLRRESR
jgi:putative DNA primase/helicase